MRFRIFPWIGGAGLLACAVALGFLARQNIGIVLVYALVGTMLFFPLVDRHWQPPALPRRLPNIMGWGLLAFLTTALLIWKSQYLEAGLSTIITAALPEEWFFRVYFMGAMGPGLAANVITSLLFSALHGFARGWPIAALVFVPSLFYGWLYQRSRDFPLLVLVHAFSNVVFMIFLIDPVQHWLGTVLAIR